ncbi:MAG: Antitoxin VapB1 [Pseudomonadota bacterium]
MQTSVVTVTVTSRVFQNGNSQAVRIPQSFRLDAKQVEIFRNSNGDLVLHPVPENRGEALLKALRAFDTEFVTLLEERYSHQPLMQERESL